MTIVNFFLILGFVYTAYSLSQNQDVKTFLKLHNEYREKVLKGEIKGQPCAQKMPPVVWDEELAANARKWASNCTAGHDKSEDRATTKFNQVGQNWAGNPSLENAFQMWFDEHKYYDLSTQKCSKVCGHYTQIVTASSTSIGCGSAECPSQRWRRAFVCNYGPAGNMHFIHQNGTIEAIPPYKAAVNCKGNNSGNNGNNSGNNGNNSGNNGNNSGNNGSSQKQAVKTFLTLHNEYRDKVRKGEINGQPCAAEMPPMVWDDELAEKAQQWASKCIVGHDEPEESATKKFPKVGQNWAGNINVENAFQMWFEEHQYYNLTTQKCSKVCGHYTQIVTASSTSIGCGSAECPSQRWRRAFVCNYGPAGNMHFIHQNGTIEAIPPYKAAANCKGNNSGNNGNNSGNNGSSQKQDLKTFLTLHNEYRDKVGKGEINGQPCATEMPPMVWDDELAEKAQQWASKCIVGHDESKERATKKFPKVGQNWAGNLNVESAFKMWFDEHRYYNLAARNCSKVCGHYTQIVTASSTSIGCGSAECPTQSWKRAFVCNYGPAGNIRLLHPDGRLEPIPPYKAATNCPGKLN